MLRDLAFVVASALALLAIGQNSVHADERASESERELARRATAQSLFDEGLRLFAEEEFAAACEKLEGSLSLHPGLGTHGKLAECYEKSGRKASAWVVYRKLVALAGREGDTTRRDIARERAERLKSEVARVTIAIDDGDRVRGMAVWRNRIPVALVALGTPVAVDAGPQKIIVWAAGYRAWTTEINAVDGETKTVTVPRLKKISQTRRLLGLSVMGAGALGTGIGLLFGARANSLQNDAYRDNRCDAENNCNDEGRALLVEANRNANWANLAVGLGIVAAAVGTYLWWTAPKGRAPIADRDGVAIAPFVVRDGAGVAFGTSF